jgi:hypothetical protein
LPLFDLKIPFKKRVFFFFTEKLGFLDFGVFWGGGKKSLKIRRFLTFLGFFAKMKKITENRHF